METRNSWWAYLEIQFNNYMMMTKSLILLVFFGFFIQMLASVYIVKFDLYKMPIQEYFNALKTFATNWVYFTFGAGATEKNFKILTTVLGSIASDIIVLFVITLPIQFAVIYFGKKHFQNKADDMVDKKYISGAILLDEQEAIKKSKKYKSNFSFGNVNIPFDDETSHNLIIGSSGSGKTQLFKGGVISKAIGQKALIHDIKGDWISEFYESSRDLIFNPLDTRSIKWTIWNDIEDIADIKNFVNWIIPENQNSKDPFWVNSARGILEACLIYLWKHDKLKNKDLKELIMLDGELLSNKLKNIPGGEFAAKKDSFLTFKSYMQWIYFLEDGNFSIKEWVENGKGFIFLSNTEKTEALFKPIMTLFINVLGSYILNLSDDLERRIYLFLDEFTSLNKLEQVIKLIKLGRSKGASIWLAFQDFQQLEKIYSREDMRTVINSCASIAVLQLKEPQAAQYFADRFGKMEFFEKNQTVSMGVAVNRDGLSFNEQRKQDYIIKPADILTLTPLKAFIMIRSIGTTLTKVPIVNFEVKNQSFIKMDLTKEQQLNMVLPNIIENKEEIKAIEEKQNQYKSFFDLTDELEQENQNT